MLSRIDTNAPWLAARLHHWLTPHARPINDARDGERTVIAGTVVTDGEPLRSPAWRRPCVWFHTSTRGGPISYSMQGQRFELGGTMFRVRDATGDALILGMAASVVRAPVAHGDGTARAAARVAGCLHLGLTGDLRSNPEICEKLICPGDHVTVIGYGAWQIDPGGAGKMATLRGETPSVFRFQSEAARHSPTVICHGPANARRVLPPGW